MSLAEDGSIDNVEPSRCLLNYVCPIVSSTKQLDYHTLEQLSSQTFAPGYTLHFVLLSAHFQAAFTLHLPCIYPAFAPTLANIRCTFAVPHRCLTGVLPHVYVTLARRITTFVGRCTQ